MGIRQRMTHRAIVERDGGTTLDPYGAHIPSIYSHIWQRTYWSQLG